LKNAKIKEIEFRMDKKIKEIRTIEKESKEELPLSARIF
jgi:hypothetical protein